MKVLYFHQHFVHPSGSGGIRSYSMAKKLIDSGYEVTMVCGSHNNARTGLDSNFINGKRTGYVDGIKVIEFQLEYSNNHGFLKRSITFIKFALRSIFVVFNEKYDLIFATSTPLTAGIPGIVGKKFLQKKFVFEVRDLWPELPVKMGVIKNPLIIFLLGILESISYKSADQLIALSPGIKDGIEKKGISSKKIDLIPNGCDIKIFNKTSDPWLPSSISNDDFVCIFAGAHGIANGLNSVLEVCDILKKRNREDIKFLLVGDGKLKQYLIEESLNRNLKNIVFHEPVSKVELANLMKSCNLGLQLLSNIPVFYYGTSPNKFFDYISAGLPVLNNYPGWIAEIIDENNCGYVVEPDNFTEFANTIEHAADNLNEIKTKSVNAFNIAQNNFDRDDLASQWVKIIEKTYK